MARMTAWVRPLCKAGLLGAVLCVGLFCIASCVDRDSASRRQTPKFNHKRHVVDEEMECSVCHRQAAQADEAGMPTYRSCQRCHQPDEDDKPNEAQIKGFLIDTEPQWSNVTRLPDDIKFSHKIHIDAKVDCATCHKGIRNSKEVTARLKVEKPECLQCHAKTNVGEAQHNCGLCHKTINPGWRPGSHERDWIQLHGRVAAATDRAHPASCEQCHTQAGCNSCHRVEQPRSHTNFFRQQGHGVLAGLDQNSCKTCHTPDSCVRCHQETRPASHRGNWSSRHCVSCHFPVRDTGCQACHKDTRSHGLAPRLPGNVVHQRATADQCRDCHRPGRLLNHPDPGENCLSCHRR